MRQVLERLVGIGSAGILRGPKPAPQNDKAQAAWQKVSFVFLQNVFSSQYSVISPCDFRQVKTNFSLANVSAWSYVESFAPELKGEDCEPTPLNSTA
jgi:hypothetical protein